MNNLQRESPEDYTIREVAGLTKQSPDIIAELVRKGRFPGSYKGGNGATNSPVRIPAAALDHYRSTQPLAYAS